MATVLRTSLEASERGGSKVYTRTRLGLRAHRGVAASSVGWTLLSEQQQGQSSLKTGSKELGGTKPWKRNPDGFGATWHSRACDAIPSCRTSSKERLTETCGPPHPHVFHSP